MKDAGCRVEGVGEWEAARCRVQGKGAACNMSVRVQGEGVGECPSLQHPYQAAVSKAHRVSSHTIMCDQQHMTMYSQSSDNSCIPVMHLRAGARATAPSFPKLLSGSSTQANGE